MRSLPCLRVLRSTAAVGAIALGSSAANAACTTANGVVTCTGPSTSDEVVAAYNRTPPPSVSLLIENGATVTRANNGSIAPNGSVFNGAIGYTNSGLVGTTGANVDYTYFGRIDLSTNTLTFDNRGTQNGTIAAFNVGGAITGTNSGTVTRAVDLRGAGPITFTNSGSVFNTGTFGGGSAITLISSRNTFGTGADGVFRQNDTGGLISATINGTVGIPANSTTAFRPQNVGGQSVGGVDLTVNGRTGGASASSFGFQSESTFRFSSVGGTNTRVQNSDDRSIGSDARVTIGESARVTGVSVGSARSATAVVNGTVDGNGFGSPAISVNATGQERSSRSTETSTSNPFSLNSSFSGFERRTGGNALADVASTARVGGGVTAFSNAGSATVRIAGQVTAGGSMVSADATGVNSTRLGRSIVRTDGSSEGSSTFTESLSGGAALVSVASTGNISFGFVRSTGDASATVDNAGRIGTSVFVTSLTTLEQRTSSSVRTIATDAAAVRTQVDRNDSTTTLEAAGGQAVVNNRLGATVGNDVRLNGRAGATLDNAGAILGSVSLNSTGSRQNIVSNAITTTTSAPAAGGGTTTTIFRDSTSTSTTRPTGGAATGTYSGTVGTANAGTFVRVEQIGTTASTATVTGTLFADFVGTAGGENIDRTETSSSRQVTQANGALTRDTSSTSRQTVTQNASTSSLTIAASGSILSNNRGGGNVLLDSAGGDAVFTLNGGRVSRDVDVFAGTGSNSVSTGSSASTFTREAPTTANRFPFEVQQRETRSDLTEERQALGTATAILNGGTIGGDLLVQGTGRGAGGLGANVSVGGTVTGVVTATSFGVDRTERIDTTATRTGPNTVARTTITSIVQGPSASNGGVLVSVNGTVGGGVLADGGSGSATVNLAGQVSVPAPGMATGRPGGVTVFSFDRTERVASEQSFVSPSFFFNGAITSSRTTTTSTATGRVATLNVGPSPALVTASRSSIEGDVIVQGFAGSVLNVATGARIVQNTGRVIVGGTTADTVTTNTGAFTGGVQTGLTTVTTSRAVGGPATLNNTGTIGSSGNAPGVSVASVGGASVNNTGTINGAITASARSFDQTTTTVTTALNTPATRRTETTRSVIPSGGAARVDNAGLVTDGVTVIGATGTAANSGVVRGRVTLGGGFSNFDSTTTTQNSSTGAQTTAVSTARPTLFNQSYRLDQNGLLLSGVSVTGATSADANGTLRRTSNVDATVNLNTGSITLGNIVADPNTTANVNLTGPGFLGVAANDVPAAPAVGQRATAFASTPSLARFTALDPLLAANVPLPSGSRISGVQTLTKSGPGSFVIVGAPQLPGVGTAAPTFTLDVGTVRITGGELQLGLAGATAAANSFGIRGNVENGADLVVGRRIVSGAQSAIQGINLAVAGSLNNAAAGNLIVGVNPGFVRSSPANAFVAFDPNGPALGSTNSFVRVDGNLTLAGAVAVQGVADGLFEAGRAYDLFSVGGTFTNTGAVRSNFASPFIGFTLTPRSEGGRTIVSLDVTRRNFDTVTTDPNAAAAANALQATLPTVFGALRAGGNAADAQDLAGIIAALDTRFDTAQAQQVFRELSSGEFYGSLSAVSTTIPFGEATDGLPASGTDSGIGLWFRPTGQFARYKDNDQAGASAINLDSYGGSIGLNYATGSGGHIGIAGGYAKLDVDAGTPEEAEADTIMVGIYGAQQLGRLHASAQVVYGDSEWDVSRTLSLLGRRATGSFDSKELRGTLRVAYTLAVLPGFELAPFGKIEARRYEFDGFTEAGAGAVSLEVGERSRTVVSPEAGIRMSGALGAALRPFAEGSYVFQGNVGSDRDMRFVGGQATNFTTQGVQPDDYIKAAIGVVADVGAGTLFVRGDYGSGGEQRVGTVRGGLLFNF